MSKVKSTSVHRHTKNHDAEMFHAVIKPVSYKADTVVENAQK